MTLANEKILAEARDELPRAVSLRRRIHANPELGLDLPETTAAVLESLAGIDLELDAQSQDERPRRDAARHATRSDAAAARRHGCAADARGHRPRVRVAKCRANARLRSRRAHRHARGRGAAARPSPRRARRRRAVHVPARRRRLRRRARDARRGSLRPDVDLARLRDPHRSAHSGRPPRVEAGRAARVRRRPRDPARGTRRPRLDAARHDRSGSRRVRDRDRDPDAGDSPHRRLRPGRDHGDPDRRGHDRQRDSGVGRDARHDPRDLGARRARTRTPDCAASSRESRPRTRSRRKSRFKRAIR